MKVAIPYENGEVFQHFGKTENFKVYEIENGGIVSAEVINSNGAGHEALAGVLKEIGVEAIICGGIGEGATSALRDAGITVFPGAEGYTDGVIAEYLAGNLVAGEANCTEHEEEHECGGCCGDCGGCCGGSVVMMEGKNANKKCTVHYRGTFNDGTQFDSSYDRGEPLEFVCGVGMMIEGFDAAVIDMEVGESKDVHIMPEQAYGERDPFWIITLEVAQLPGSEKLSVGQQVCLTGDNGQPILATVTAREGTTITFDANPEMAGKELNFHIELLAVE